VPQRQQNNQYQDQGPVEPLKRSDKGIYLLTC
jgi:hypothetical protein